MTLLELFNLSVTLFMFPNNDGQPGIFPTPSFGDYLEDWAHYLRTHMPYADDIYQRGIRKFLVVELFLIYFYLMLILRRFRLAQIYLLVKVITFALLFLTSGASYWNFLAWPLCFIVYPLEVLVVFMMCALFLHRHALPKLKNKKTGLYKVYKDIKVRRFRKDGSTYWAEAKEFYAMRGIFTPDRMYYHLGLFALYSFAKYKMILGNPLATFYRLWSTDSAIDNRDFVAGLTFDPEFGFPEGRTTKRSDYLYRLVENKYPVVKEIHRRADAADIKISGFSKKISLEKQRDTLFEILELPTYTLFGFRFPSVVDQQRFEANNASRWLDLPYKWVSVTKQWPSELDQAAGEERVARIEYLLYRRFLDTLVLPKKSTAEPNRPAPKPMHTLAQRIIDNLTTDQFTATKEAVLNPDTKLYTSLTDMAKNSTVGRIPPQRWRYKSHREYVDIIRYVSHKDLKTNRIWLTTYRRPVEVGHGWSLARPAVRARSRHTRSQLRYPTKAREFLNLEPREPLSHWKKFEWVGKHKRHPHWTLDPAWQKKYEQPEVRTGFTGFNFEQFAPLMELDSISNLRYGLLFILALSSLTVYSIILAGWSSNSKYAFLGALRSAAQMISYEVSISLALLPVILLSGSLNLTAIVYGQIGTVWYLFPLLPIALVFLVSMLAETNRTPFDLPEAEAELVAGYNVDYSSLPFAMFFLGEYSNMILISVLFCLLFLGGWDGAVVALQEPYVLTFKAAFVWIFFVIVRATLPRYRYDQLMDIGWKAFLPFAGSFLVFVLGLVVFLDIAPVVEEVAREDLYGAPASFLLELDPTTPINPSLPSTVPSAPQVPAVLIEVDPTTPVTSQLDSSLPDIVRPPSYTPLSWWSVVGYTSLTVGFILATGGLGAAIAAGGGAAGISGIGGVVGVASAGGAGGTAVAVLTSTTPTALMVKLSLLLGLSYSVYATQMGAGVAVATADAVEFNELLVESEMPEYCRKLFLKMCGVTDPGNIPPNFKIWFQYHTEAKFIHFGHYNRFGIFEVNQLQTLNFTADTRRRLTWISMRLLGLEPPEELLFGFNF